MLNETSQDILTGELSDGISATEVTDVEELRADTQTTRQVLIDVMGGRAVWTVSISAERATLLLDDLRCKFCSAEVCVVKGRSSRTCARKQ